MEKSTHSPLYDAFRRRLVSLRKEAGLTQRQLAARMKREQNFVIRIEGGDRRLDILEFYWFCQALDQDPLQIIQQTFTDFDRMSLRTTRKKSK